MNTADHGRVVWITGATGGLGGALVEVFAEAGWRVSAAGHSRCPDSRGDRVRGIRLDVTDRAAVRGCVSETIAAWGRLDLLINNAGLVRDSSLARLSDEDWRRVLDVNLKGAFLCAQAVLPAMLRRKSGHILNIASHAAKNGARGQANYAAAKAGLIGLTVALAREVGSRGIQVNAILPGVLPTAMTAGLPAEALEAFVAANALGRLNDPARVAWAILGIASLPDVSGQVFTLDSRIGRWT